MTVLSAGDATLYTFPVHKGHRAVRETHCLSKDIVKVGKSGPPLHIHLRQAEIFEVEQGVLGVIRNGVEIAVKKEDGPVLIEPGVRHRFWAHPASNEDLVFTVWVEPDALDRGFDESFMRNSAGYMKDCEKHGLAPSIFQISLFMYNADIFLTPPFWVPIWFLAGLHYFLGYWVGAVLLGYRTSYPEYSNLVS
ncbi:unnamed protein product [Discula destructiva]